MSNLGPCLGTSLVSIWHGCVWAPVALSAALNVSTLSIQDATLLVSKDPRNPSLVSITLVAMLKGLWVVGTALFTGPAIKYNRSLSTPRILFATQAFKAANAASWLALLETVSADKAKQWKVVATPQEWAAAKAIAEKKKVPSSVIALVVESEQTPNLKHAFTLHEFITFVRRVDDTKGSIGLLGM